VFIERGRAALDALRGNVKSLGLVNRADVRQGKTTALIDRLVRPTTEYIVFLDPPYEMEQEYELVLQKLAEEAPGLVIAQHSKRCVLKEGYGVLHRTRMIQQGDNALSFYEPAALTADSPT
jgi:16S rRNA G966 N2-methylase RsmD